MLCRRETFCENPTTAKPSPGYFEHKLKAIGVAMIAMLVLGTTPAMGQYAGRPSRVNINGTGVQANNESWAVALSADGKLVAFASDADNLVSLDTNEDTDIFLHDTTTGITSRVSMNWQGKQAAGDSDCPAITGDGRYVAFRSRASNMLQDGSTVGPPAWEVFLHDRQGPLTIQVSRPLQGGPGTADSGCPVISADGTRIAFASQADDLLAGDTNGFSDIFVYDIGDATLSRASIAEDGSQADGDSMEPSISGDGSIVAFSSTARNLTSASIPNLYQPQVYTRDFLAGTTELISRAVNAPVLLAQGESREPKISADGTLVLFFSTMSMPALASSGFPPWRLFLFDRTTGLTDVVEPLAFAEDRPAVVDPLFYDRSRSKAAAISADGRFIAFLSGSFALLPENSLFHTDQIFILDRQTHRLRRLTVDPTGYPLFTHPCGGSSGTLALSGDGRTLAFVGENTERIGLSPSDGLAVRDVVRLEWTCDPKKQSCRALSACPNKPSTTCVASDNSQLSIRRNPPLSAARNRFEWRWRGPGDLQGQTFPDPAESEYQLCVYAGETMSTQIDVGIPGDNLWKKKRSGWTRKNPGGALNVLRLRSRGRSSGIKVVSRAPILDLPYLPLEIPRGVNVQLHETNSGRCWESDFPPESIKRNTRGGISPAGGLRGLFRATIK